MQIISRDAVALCVPMDDGAVLLMYLFTPKPLRGQGRAAAVMAMLCARADKERKNILLKLEVEAWVDEPRLRAFYKARGFEEAKDDPNIMVRLYDEG